jgi:N-sulfoglucosamine sulfohydrolase
MKLGLTILFLAAGMIAAAQAQKPLNVLFLTVDDMSSDSVGAFGCKVADTTPHIDKLASEGVRFEHAHVQVANCMPSRNVMQSGRYPHNSGMEGFYYNENPDYKILPDILKENGYFIGINGKATHTTPYFPYPWDIGRHSAKGDAQAFYDHTKESIEAAEAAGKPFYFVVNIADPHRPFYGMSGKREYIDNPMKPTKVFTADEIVVPGFLPDTPVVRKEIAHYYSSVRRADDSVGAVLRALKDSGREEDTLIVFLSDHGMALPFAKTTVYQHGTNTPWIVKWPGVTRADTVDREHMISTVDFAPTVLDILDIENPEKMDGRSFEPLLKGEKQSGREWVFKVYNENSSGKRNPMRAIQTKQFCYVFNPWSNGKKKFVTATTGSLTYGEMERLAEIDSEAAERLQLFDYRVLEELYDVKADPDALNNLIANPEYEQELRRLRQALEYVMDSTGDHMLPVFQQMDDPSVAEAYMIRVQSEADQRRREGKQKPNRNKDKK